MGLEAKIAPIADTTFVERLMTLPSILFFYISKFIFPWDMATRYFWVHKEFSFENVLLPLIAATVVIGLFVCVGIQIKKHLRSKDFKTYIFFAIWAISAIFPYLQFVPLDMTACINWFYFSMVGVLGMLGVSAKLIKKNSYTLPLTIVGIIIYIALAVSSIIQGTYYKNPEVLARHDYAVSSDNYAALNDLSQAMLRQNEFKHAETFARQSVDIYPTLFNHQNLGVALQQQKNYPGARDAYENALKYGSQLSTHENLAMVALLLADHEYTRKVLTRGLEQYPNSSKLWLFSAIFEGSHGSEDKAKQAITKAAELGSAPPAIATAIFTEQSYDLVLPNSAVHYPIR